MRNYMRSYIWCVHACTHIHTCTHTQTDKQRHKHTRRAYSQLPLVLDADPDGDGLSTLLELYNARQHIRTYTHID
jgi:hypothetical protein